MEESYVNHIQQNLLRWYDKNQRRMPWRKPSSAEVELDIEECYVDGLSHYDHAYGVLVSEFMLQQTQVATVKPYFRKWMKQFPTITDLANADEQLINQLWAGLGYYRRAKSLHNCAKEIVAKHQGKVPETADLLCELPGIGQYTAGAIASIAFGEATPLVDGNVVRVLARLRAISDDTKAKETIAKFWALATELLSHSRPGDFNQSLMELGATVCTKQPKCAECPIQDQCLAYKEATAMHQNGASADVEDLFKNTYPAKPKKKEKKELRTFVSVIEFTNAKNKFLLLRQRPSTGLLASLWEFPSLDIDSNFDVAEFDYDKFQTSVDANMKKLGIDMTTTTVVSRSFVGTATHLFTHIRQTLWVESIKLVDVATTNDAPTQFVNDKSVWCVSDEVNNLAISNGSLKCFSLAVNGVTKKTKLRAPPTSNSEPTPKKRKLANLKGQSKLSFGKATD